MLEVIESTVFKQWRHGIKDKVALARIAARIRNAGLGNMGDHKFLRAGVSEMRIDVGAGYRLYFTRRGNAVVLLLCGGDKRTQEVDIQRAIALAQQWKE